VAFEFVCGLADANLCIVRCFMRTSVYVDVIFFPWRARSRALALSTPFLSLPLSPPTHPPLFLMGMFLVCFRDQDVDADDFVGKFSVSIAQILKENRVRSILVFVSPAGEEDHSFITLLFVDTLSQLAFSLFHQCAIGCWWSGVTMGSHPKCAKDGQLSNPF
jgi:hypothetical protein